MKCLYNSIVMNDWINIRNNHSFRWVNEFSKQDYDIVDFNFGWVSTNFSTSFPLTRKIQKQSFDIGSFNDV